MLFKLGKSDTLNKDTNTLHNDREDKHRHHHRHHRDVKLLHWQQHCGS